MNEHIQRIIEILQALLACNRQLIEYGKAKTEAIRTHHLEGISFISNKEKKLLEEMEELERQRVFQVGKYMISQRAVKSQSFKMDKLIQAVYVAEEKQELQRIWEELDQTISLLQEINAFNQHLVLTDLEYVQFSQDVLLGPEEEEVTYHKAVQGMAAKRTGRIDRGY